MIADKGSVNGMPSAIDVRTELIVHAVAILQVMPLPPGWEFNDGGDESYPAVALALCELECSNRTSGERWTGRQIFPVDRNLEVEGIPGEGFYLAHALGDMRHGITLDFSL